MHEISSGAGDGNRSFLLKKDNEMNINFPKGILFSSIFLCCFRIKFNSNYQFFEEFLFSFWQEKGMKRNQAKIIS